MTKRILQFTLCMLLTSCISQAQNYQWAKQLGGTRNNETSGSVVTDANGNVFVTGWFSGTVTIGSSTLTSHGSDDIYVVKMDSGGAVQWAFREGGVASDRGYGIALDGSGNIYITGQIGGTDTFGTATILTTNGSSDGYIAKYNSSAALQWAVNCGSTRGDRSNAITLDDSNNVYICGWFGQAGGGSPGGAATINFGSLNFTGVGGTDFFVAKANGSNGNWMWGVGTGSRNANTPDVLNDIQFANNQIYVCGAFIDTINVGKNTLISAGNLDIFWASLTKQGLPTASGSAGSRQTDNGGGVTSDPSGNIYITGVFNQTAFGGGGGADSMKVGNSTLNGTKAEAYVAAFDQNMNVKWANSYGDTSTESATRITCDNNYNLFVGGLFQTVTTIGGTKYTSGGGNDVYLMSLDTSGTVQWSKSFGTTNNEDIRDITSDSRGQYVVGSFGNAAGGGGGAGGGSVAFNGSVSITSAGGGDGYCVKLYTCPGISSNVTLSGLPNFCQSGSLTMKAAAGATSYQWYLNSNAINGVTTDTHTIFSAGAYYCLLTNSSGCQINSATTTVNIGNPPTASINTVSTSICQGDSVIMTAGSGSNYTYKYYYNNTAVTGWVTTTTYFAKQAGDYKVEVDNFGCTAFSSTITMTTIATPTVTIKSTGSTNICVGDTVILQSDTNSTWTYTWQRLQGANYIAVNGQNADIFYCTAVGTFRMLVSTTSGCGVASNSITITTTGPTNANLNGMPGSGPLCKGDSITLQTAGGGGITYQWYKDGNAIAGATNRLYRIKTSGTFKVTLTGGGCIINSKDTVVAFINESASVTPNGSAGLCPGDTLKFLATGDAGSTFSWFRNSNSIPGANTANYAATQTGNYSCVISLSTCSYQSPNVVVTLFPAAAVPSIVQNGNNLASSISGTSYTWYLNNSTVVGNTQFIYGWSTGFYKVVVSDANGCKGESPLFSFSNNGISGVSMERLNIYPNPTNGQVMVDLNTSETTLITLSDMSGKRIYTEALKATNGIHSIDLSNYPQGLYIIQVQSGNRNFVNRIELVK
ncbi:MAG: T9SS type A sorting domain-containing protein [Flavobacteriaceae bacterium]|nr:T9SS type A sorting domain-containing protein [Flavobacteriaceae bacterium]